MRVLAGRIWRLTYIAASGPGAWIGILLYAAILSMKFGGVWVSVQFIDWYARFYDAIEQLDASAAIHELWVFFGLTGLSAGSFLIGEYLRKYLWLRWRERLTHYALDAWTKNKAYWSLRPGLSADSIDNPDQRIAQDCRLFVDGLLLETLDIITRAVALVSYLAILWSLTGFVISFSVFGKTFEIAHYLIWLAFIYVAISSVITHLIGKPLKPLIFRQEMREADFRHSLIQLRDNANEIALSDGEPAERTRLNQGFNAIRINWYKLLRREFILGLFSRPYFQTILRVPLFFSLPAYFMAGVTLGGLMQLARAFGNVTQTLSYFIFSYQDLAELAAVAHRLDDLIMTASNPNMIEDVPREIKHEDSKTDRLKTTDLQLLTPQGRRLADIPDMEIKPGERVLIAGPSGIGKSTLISAISGIWPFGSGRIQVPDRSMMVIPQKSYLFTGSLAAAASYPNDPSQIDQNELIEILHLMGLEHRLNLLHKQGEEALQGLSMGERQRLALARVFLHKPEWLVLDEATSALDRAFEKRILGELITRLPDTTILFATHREYGVFEPYTSWQLRPLETTPEPDPIAQLEA